MSDSPHSVVSLSFNGMEYYAVSSNDGDDTVSTTAQFKMFMGEVVYVNFRGYFFMPEALGHTVFEGHLITKV